MVGVGPRGAESSLTRVTYHRTQWSGIRASDMARAAVRGRAGRRRGAAGGTRARGARGAHDLKVLMLGHLRGITRDTQYHAGKARMLGTNRPALRNLVKAEVGVSIQEGSILVSVPRSFHSRNLI